MGHRGELEVEEINKHLRFQILTVESMTDVSEVSTETSVYSNETTRP
jgi:hypothetical protein